MGGDQEEEGLQSVACLVGLELIMQGFQGFVGSESKARTHWLDWAQLSYRSGWTNPCSPGERPQ